MLPLAGSLELLEEELELDPDQKKLFEIVHREMEQVERFVGGLLRYTRHEQMHRARVDLADLAREAVETHGLTRQGGPEVRAEGESVAALVDPDEVRQALRNVVLNAVDAVGENGTVVVRTGVDGSVPWIEVEDDGPGIPAARREEVLRPFVTGKAGGTGLGLAIVTRIVEDHGGLLSLEEGGQGGARVRMAWPAPAVTEAAA